MRLFLLIMSVFFLVTVAMMYTTNAQDDEWTVISQLDESDVPMVFVPHGIFIMGRSIESEIQSCQERIHAHYEYLCSESLFQQDTPEHEVSVDDFWFDQYEVTFGQYRACIADGICSNELLRGLHNVGINTDDTLPVFGLTNEDAVALCEWRSARLPTEAEWEYALRGTTDYAYPWGDEFIGTNTNVCDSNCNRIFFEVEPERTWDDGFAFAAPVGSFPNDVSWVGAYDMVGNVMEWTSTPFEGYEGADFDWAYLELYLGNPVVRGASYHTPHITFSSTYRFGSSSIDYIDLKIGFRCARTPDDIMLIPE